MTTAERMLFDVITDSNEFKWLAGDDDYQKASDVAVTYQIINANMNDFFTYIADSGVVYNHYKVRTYTTSQAVQMLKEHTKNLFKLTLDKMPDDELPNNDRNHNVANATWTKETAKKAINQLIDRMSIANIAEYKQYVVEE